MNSAQARASAASQNVLRSHLAKSPRASRRADSAAQAFNAWSASRERRVWDGACTHSTKDRPCTASGTCAATPQRSSDPQGQSGGGPLPPTHQGWRGENQDWQRLRVSTDRSMGPGETQISQSPQRMRCVRCMSGARCVGGGPQRGGIGPRGGMRVGGGMLVARGGWAIPALALWQGQRAVKRIFNHDG